ncbi:MAG: PLAT/LH2 domain-containing protein [Polyangia bacterium]
MRYIVTIRTSSGPLSGTDARAFLSLNGDAATLREVEFSDPTDSNPFEPGDVNTEVFETDADLGEILSGTLREDGANFDPNWQVDFVRVVREADGREWVANLSGSWSRSGDRGGVFPLLRFVRVHDGGV